MRKNNEPSPRTPKNGAREEGDSRRNSASSQLYPSTTSPNYDSGNISDLNVCLRPASLSSAEDDSLQSQHDQFQYLLREKDQVLFLAMQDVRKLKSELERLNKSEKWYKTELKSQKNSRMELLEKLYTNERKFTQENHRLQNECIALYARCSEIENQLQEKKELASKLLKSCSKVEAAGLDNGDLSRDFELQQHRQRLADQEQLIDLLRNQKRTLLNDLQKLSAEKDEVVLQLQSSIAQLVDENRTITKRCLQLVEAKIVLKDELFAKEKDCKTISNTVLDLKLIVKGLQEQLHSHLNDLNRKENEVHNLEHELSQRDNSVEMFAQLEKKHQHELSQKQESIYSLNNIISCLRTEIDSLEELRTHYDEQQREIYKLKYLLDEQTSEVDQLRRFNEILPNQSVDRQSNIAIDVSSILQNEKEELIQQNESLRLELNSMYSKYETTSQNLKQENLRTTELEQLSEKYLNVCKLYENSKFDLDMKDITLKKLKFEKEKDTQEIEILRERVVEILKQFECQKSLAIELEFSLSRLQQDKCRLETENKWNMERNFKLNTEAMQNVKYENDEEVENLKTQLSNVEDLLSKQNAKINTSDLTTSILQKDFCEKNVELFQRLVSQKSNKVEQLNAELQKWENILTLISVEESPNQLDVDCSEFDNLNQLFDEQNLELMQINENHREENLSIRKAIENTVQQNKTFQDDLETAKSSIISKEKQVEDLNSANVDYQKKIDHLALINERLIQEFNKDFSRERKNNKKQRKKLELEVKLRSTESNKLKEEMQLLQSEFDKLNTKFIKSSQKLLEVCDSDRQKDEPVQDSAQNRILQNVLETEHRRKMTRYDVHIRSLLSNMKSYKKKLELAENRYDALLAKSKEMVEVEEFRAMERNLQTMRTQFECSQRELNNLKHQLKTVREQFYVNDGSKSSNTMVLTNLMDDYKKIIQQSQTATKRLSTSEIYDLINKSNNFVPKLTNISTSVNELREDIQQTCTVMKLSSSAGRGSPQLKMSLMDELQLANKRKLC